MGDAIRKEFATVFSTEGHGRWSPLARRTVRERELLGYPGRRPILRRTGDLRGSFTDPNNPDHAEEFVGVGDGWAITAGSNDDRAERLNDGDFGDNLPPRPINEFDGGAEDRIGDVIELVAEQTRRDTVGR